MKRFFQKMPQFLKYGAALIAGGLYIWALIFLLKSDNWVGISALTTMLLAIAAFWAIRQNHNLQKRERRDRLLNEIIQWAIDVSKCVPDETISVATGTGAATVNVDQIKITKLGLLYLTLSARSAYMADIAGLVFGEDIHNAVKTVARNLDKFEDVLRKYLACISHIKLACG